MSLHFLCQASYIRSTSYCMVHFTLHASRCISNHTPNIVSGHIYVSFHVVFIIYQVISYWPVVLPRFPERQKPWDFRFGSAWTKPWQSQKCLLMEYLLTSVYHGSSLPEKSNISIYLFKWRNIYIYILLSETIADTWKSRFVDTNISCWWVPVVVFFGEGYVYRLFQEMPLAAALVSNTLPFFRELSSWGWCISLVNENQRRSPEISEILKITGSSNILCKYLKI